MSKIITDKKEALKMVKHNGKMILYVSEELKNDKEVLLEAVKNNYFTIVNEEIYNLFLNCKDRIEFIKILELEIKKEKLENVLKENNLNKKVRI